MGKIKDVILKGAEQRDSKCCLLCFHAVETNLDTTEERQDVLYNAYNYLHAGAERKNHVVSDLKKEKLNFCKNCYEFAVRLTERALVSETLVAGYVKMNLEKNIARLKIQFSLDILTRLNAFHSKTGDNKTLDAIESGSELEAMSGPNLFPLGGIPVGKSIDGIEHAIVSENESLEYHSISPALEEQENEDVEMDYLEDNIQQAENTQEEDTHSVTVEMNNGDEAQIPTGQITMESGVLNIGIKNVRSTSQKYKSVSIRTFNTEKKKLKTLIGVHAYFKCERCCKMFKQGILLQAHHQSNHAKKI